MKNKKLFLILAIAAGISSIAATATLLSSNGRAGYTNSPGELNCTDCHGSFAVNSGPGTVTLTSTIPGWSYCPGQTYTITATVAQTGFPLFGLDVEALSGTGPYANAGTFVITSTETTIKTFTVSGVVRNNVTHTGTGNNTTNSHTFTFNWIAPATNVGNVTFYVAGMAANGTGGTSGDYVYTTSQVVTPAASVAASVGIAASSNPICAGSTVTFTATPTNGGTTPTYQWKLNGVNVGANSSTYSNGTLANGNIITCVMTSNAGCVTGNPATSNAITMTVNPSVTASVSIAASANPVCSGSTVTFTATPSNGGTTPIYQWTLNGANVGTNSSTYSNSTLANGNIVTCIMTSNASCVSGSPATSNTVTMTVNPNVSANVSIVATSSTICSGTNVTFTATPVNGGTTPAYQWRVNGVNAGTNNATYANSTLANGDAVTCVLTSNATCVIDNPVTSNAITMTVNPNVAASISIAASSNPVCAGASVTFTATPTNGGTTPTFQWKLNGVNVGTNSSTYANSTLANGNIITCVLTSNASCVTGSPATSNAITMTVNPIVTAAVSIAASGNPVCSGSTVTFTATPSNGGTTPTYQWTLNGANVGTNISTYSNSTLANGNIVTCVMTSNASCVSGSPATSNAVTMTVNPNVSANVSIVATSSTICSGTNVTFTATPVNGGTTPAYQWRVNGVNAGTNNATYANSTLANGDVVTCVLTSNATCVTGSPATSNSVTMTVNPNIAASISIAASSNPVCAGASVTFTATPTNGGTTPTFQWKLNGVNVGTNSSTYVNSTLANGNIITCVLTSNATCVTGSPATSNAITMTVNPIVTAAVSIAASANPVCSGSTVTFTATPSNGGTTPTYQWMLNGANVGANSSTYSNSTLANGNIVTCIMTSNASCVSGSPATSNAVTMTVNPNVSANVSIVATSNTICSGTNVTFTATPVNGGTTPVYQWRVNGVNAGTNNATYANSTLANGDIVTCVLTSNATCVTGSPATSNPITMTVTPILVPEVSISASVNPICSGLTVTFTATPLNEGSSPIYQWSLNGANVGTNSSTYANAGLANGDDITCVMTSNLACANPLIVTSNTITMTVSGVLTPSLIIAASDNPTCQNSSVTFTATPTNGGMSPSYQWMLNGINVGTNSPTYINATLVTGDQVMCNLTSSLNCASPVMVTSNTVTMTITAPVTPSINISASANPVCSGTNVTFSAVPVNEGTNPSYQWMLNGTDVGTNSSVYMNATLVNGDVVSCILTSDAACANPAVVTSNEITMTINPTVTPDVAIIATANPICAGTAVTFTATPTNGGSIPVYQWMVNGVNVGTDNPVFISTSLSNGDAVSCVLTSDMACASPLAVTSNTILMTVNTIPATPVISTVGGDLQSNTVSGNQWYLNNGTIAGANGQSFTPLQNGIYYVIVTVNGCTSDTSNIINVTDVGIQEIVENNSLIIYPNPANSLLKIELGVAGIVTDKHLLVYDVLGTLVIDKIFAGNKFLMDITNLSAGLYLLKVESKEGLAMKKFIKE